MFPNHPKHIGLAQVRDKVSFGLDLYPHCGRSWCGQQLYTCKIWCSWLLLMESNMILILYPYIEFCSYFYHPKSGWTPKHSLIFVILSSLFFRLKLAIPFTFTFFQMPFTFTSFQRFQKKHWKRVLLLPIQRLAKSLFLLSHKKT